MSDSTPRLWVLATSALLVGAFVTGCSGGSAPDADAPTPRNDETPSASQVPTASPSSPSLLDFPEVRARIESAVGAAERPSKAEAEQEALRVAQVTWPDAHFQSAILEAIGRDSQGRWWVQVVTPSDFGEGEVWFLIRAASGWAYVTSGTGTDRSVDLPSDIAWEDIH